VRRVAARQRCTRNKKSLGSSRPRGFCNVRDLGECSPQVSAGDVPARYFCNCDDVCGCGPETGAEVAAGALFP
jgi:hypothetical protein